VTRELKYQHKTTLCQCSAALCITHINEIAEKSPQQQFEGNKTMSAVITL
jgi:hypothetical protein